MHKSLKVLNHQKRLKLKKLFIYLNSCYANAKFLRRIHNDNLMFLRSYRGKRRVMYHKAMILARGSTYA